ncbi:hypothetical protein BJV78DRAFT_1153227 [Lactifluus subvellereus]|nr:hypothetical protein BJV78DRAFT_1153227 [Lactifluus subvellereus]
MLLHTRSSRCIPPSISYRDLPEQLIVNLDKDKTHRSQESDNPDLLHLQITYVSTPLPDMEPGNLSSHMHIDDRILPAIIPAVPPSLTSVVVDVHNPTAEQTSPSTNSQRLTNDSYVKHPPIARLSSLSAAAEESSQLLPPASHVMSDHQWPEGDVPRLITSEQVPRYTRDITILGEETPYTIEPLTRTFPYSPERSLSDQGSPNQDCRSWTPATHPGGALYFFDPERDGRIQWSYYYACHETRCLFWLDAYVATDIISEISGVKSPAHVKHRLEALYWNHWSLYPIFFPGRDLPVSICDELIGILSHGCVEPNVDTTDTMTSSSSTLPYDVDTMQKMIELVKNARAQRQSSVWNIKSLGFVLFSAHLLSRFAIWRFLYFHGQPHARLVSHQTVYSKSKLETHLIFLLLSPVLFFAPTECLRDIEKWLTDDFITTTAWGSFMNEKEKEWTDLIFPVMQATVMLAVNVSFLAIPGVILSDSNAKFLTSLRQIILIPLVQTAGFSRYWPVS